MNEDIERDAYMKGVAAVVLLHWYDETMIWPACETKILVA